MKAKAPLPNIVYNRIAFRNTEKQAPFQKALSILQEKNIPFFNPSFLNKWDLYELLEKHPLLKNYLPETTLLSNFEQLEDFLEKYKCIYVKSLEGYKGKHIYRIEKITPSHYNVSTTKDTEIYSNLENLWNNYSIWQKKSFLIQKGIDSALFQGKRYDFRLLVTYKDEAYVLNGIGVRQSIQQDITTHIPSGGKLIPYQEVQSDSHDVFFETIAQHCGKLLTEQYGFFGEFSIDACIDKEGKYYIFEVNSKPMLFDEPHIEEARINHLLYLFYSLSNFPHREWDKEK